MPCEDDHQNLQATAAKADKLWAVRAHQQHSTVSSVEFSLLQKLPAESIATVRGGKRGSLHRKGCGGFSSNKPATAPLNSGSAVYTPPLASLARQSAGLCFTIGPLETRGFLNAVTPSRLVQKLLLTIWSCIGPDFQHTLFSH